MNKLNNNATLIREIDAELAEMLSKIFLTYGKGWTIIITKKLNRFDFIIYTNKSNVYETIEKDNVYADYHFCMTNKIEPIVLLTDKMEYIPYTEPQAIKLD